MTFIGTLKLERGYLGRLIASRPKTENGLTDMRGFNWNHAHKERTYYSEDRILKVDFSNSKADEGFWIKDAIFEECVFDNSVWWSSLFGRKIIRCSFNNCSLRDSLLGGKFYNCSFKNFTLRTGGAGFGWCSEYKNCIFENVYIRDQFNVIGVRFEDCKISGTFEGNVEGCVFRGWRYALNERFSSVTDIFDSRHKPVRFIRCDLSNLKTKNIIFEKDIIFRDNILGSQFYVNNPGCKIPPEKAGKTNSI